jgi:hypothetical protein
VLLVSMLHELQCEGAAQDKNQHYRRNTIAGLRQHDLPPQQPNYLPIIDTNDYENMDGFK